MVQLLNKPDVMLAVPSILQRKLPYCKQADKWEVWNKQHPYILLFLCRFDPMSKRIISAYEYSLRKPIHVDTNDGTCILDHFSYDTLMPEMQRNPDFYKHAKLLQFSGTRVKNELATFVDIPFDRFRIAIPTLGFGRVNSSWLGIRACPVYRQHRLQQGGKRSLIPRGFSSQRRYYLVLGSGVVSCRSSRLYLAAPKTPCYL